MRTAVGEEAGGQHGLSNQYTYADKGDKERNVDLSPSQLKLQQGSKSWAVLATGGSKELGSVPN